MKKIVLICISLISLSLNAQTRSKIIACGGKFEFNPPITDRATIGVVLCGGVECNYVPFDTIEVESVQKIAISNPEDGYIFLAAQDSIMQYKPSLSEEAKIKKINQIPFKGIKTVVANDDYLIAGKWYGSGDYLVVYDATTMVELFASPTIKTEIKDILILNDTLLAVAYNLKGDVDGCAPWGCFADSLGRIDIISLDRGVTTKTIDLGVLGKGDISLQKNYSNGLNSLSSDMGYFSYFDKDLNLVLDSANTGLEKLLTTNSSLNNDVVYALSKKDSMETWQPKLANSSFYKLTADSSIKFKSKISIPRIESVTSNLNQLTYLETDYSTFGNAIFGNEIVKTGISPQDVGYINVVATLVGLENLADKTTIDLDNISTLDFDKLTIYDLRGLEVVSSHNSQDVNVTNLQTGVYVLLIEQENIVQKLKAYKK